MNILYNISLRRNIYNYYQRLIIFPSSARIALYRELMLFNQLFDYTRTQTNN